MTKPRFQIRMMGSGVAPETVKVSDLADVLLALEKAILATVAAQAGVPPDGATVSLVSVEEGSNNLTLAVASVALAAVSAISHAVAAQDYHTLPPSAQLELATLSKQMVKRDWVVEFLADPALHIEHAKISTEHPVPEPLPPPSATGTTVVFGRCVRVGGAGAPRAEIRLPEGNLLYIDVSEEMAKELARRLYDEVCIEGRATWRTTDWTLLDFKAAHVTDYRPTGLVEAFEQLARAAGGRWNNVRADEYVRELRSEDDP